MSAPLFLYILLLRKQPKVYFLDLIMSLSSQVQLLDISETKVEEHFDSNYHETFGLRYLSAPLCQHFSFITWQSKVMFSIVYRLCISNKPVFLIYSSKHKSPPPPPGDVDVENFTTHFWDPGCGLWLTLLAFPRTGDGYIFKL